MGKHNDRSGAEAKGGSGKYDGRHRAPEVKTEHDPNASFHVDSPERAARGIGNRQTGGRD